MQYAVIQLHRNNFFAVRFHRNFQRAAVLFILRYRCNDGRRIGNFHRKRSRRARSGFNREHMRAVRQRLKIRLFQHKFVAVHIINPVRNRRFAFFHRNQRIAAERNIERQILFRRLIVRQRFRRQRRRAVKDIQIEIQRVAFRRQHRNSYRIACGILFAERFGNRQTISTYGGCGYRVIGVFHKLFVARRNFGYREIVKLHKAIRFLFRSRIKARFVFVHKIRNQFGIRFEIIHIPYGVCIFFGGRINHIRARRVRILFAREEERYRYSVPAVFQFFHREVHVFRLRVVVRAFLRRQIKFHRPPVGIFSGIENMATQT